MTDLHTRLQQAQDAGHIHPEQWPEVHVLAVDHAMRIRGAALAKAAGVSVAQLEDCIQNTWLLILTDQDVTWPNPNFNRAQYAVQKLRFQISHLAREERRRKDREQRSISLAARSARLKSR